MQSVTRGPGAATLSFPCPPLVQIDPPDWELVVASRQNVLLQGAEPALHEAVTLLRRQLCGPIQHWLAGHGVPLPPRLAGATFLMDVDACSDAEQAALLEWLQEADCRVQVVSTTRRKLHDSVERGEFRADLYYRLNIVLLELEPKTGTPVTGLMR
jgi:hypothetical protein